MRRTVTGFPSDLERAQDLLRQIEEEIRALAGFLSPQVLRGMQDAIGELRVLCELGPVCRCTCGCDRTDNVVQMYCGNCRGGWHRPQSEGAWAELGELTEQEWRDFCEGAGIDPDG